MVRLVVRLALLVSLICTVGVYPRVTQAAGEFPVVTESLTHWTVADGMLYWAMACPGGEFLGPGYLKRKPVNGGVERTLSTTTNDNCVNFLHMAADATGLYYYSPAESGIYFRPSGDPFDPPRTILRTAEGPAGQTNLVLAGNTIYWLSWTGKILSVNRDGTGLQEFANGIPGGRDLLIVGSTAYWLDDSGLWRASLSCSPLPCAAKSRMVAANGRHLMYVRTGLTVPSRADNFFWIEYSSPEIIRRHRCGTFAVCTTSTFYTAPDVHTSLGEPASDGSQLFWTEQFRGPGEQPDGRLRRKSVAGGDAVEIVTNIPFVAQELETDSLHVYYHIQPGSTPAGGIYRIPLNAAAIERDLAANSIEVTQGIQNLANNAPLVAHKTTYVRAYGSSTTGPAARSVDALLHGERGGVPLPGSPLRPLNGVLGLTPGVIYDRSRLDDSWLYKLPASWTGAGNISLRLVVDPQAVYSDIAPSNNALAATVSFGTTGPVCTIFVPVRTDAPAASTNTANFWPMIDVARRLWPTHDYWVYKSGVGVEELQDCWAGPFPYPCGGPFELPDDTWKVFLGIGTIDVFTDDPDECQDANGSIHYVGMVHSGTDTTNDDGFTTNGTGMTAVFNYSWVKLPTTMPVSPQDPVAPDAGVTLAHELAHNKGRQHVNCGGPDNPDPGYPYPATQIGPAGNANYYGFDAKTRRVIAPTAAKDFMSYCDPVWTSDYTWRALYNSLNGAAAGQASARVAAAQPAAILDVDLAATAHAVLVTGAVTPTLNTGELGYAYNFPTASLGAGLLRKWQGHTAAATRARSMDAAAPNQHAVFAANYHVRLLDAAGNVLADQPVTPVAADMEEASSPALYFITTFPAPSGAVTKLELLQDRTVIATQTPGSAAPTVQINKPAGGETIGDTIELSWSASDRNPDDILRYAVQYSPDGGATWQAIFSDIIGPPKSKTVSLTINALNLAGSTPNGGRLRVAASDGYNTAIAVSRPFTVSNRKPEAFIVDPAPGVSLPAGEAITLRGDANDVEDGGLRGESLHWTVDGVAAGTGEELVLGAGLAPGTHDVVLTARDALGQIATAARKLRVLPLDIPAAAAPILDAACDDVGYADATEVPLGPYSDGARASVRLIRGSDALWACFSGLKPGASSPGAFVGLRVDRNLSRDALAQNDDFGFLVGEDGGISTVQGNGSGGFAVPGPGGLTAQVSSNGTVWQAELRIDAAVLNGFEHHVGLELGHYAVGSAGDDYRWPSASVFNKPSSWGQTALGDAPTIEVVSPATATAGGPAVRLAISGEGFITGTIALFDGASLPTTVVSPTLLNATVTADKLTMARTLPVVVRNPGNLDSNPLLFQVRNPRPAINALSPNTAAAGGPAFTLRVNGTGFVRGAQVYWDGEPLPTTFVNAGQLSGRVDAARIAQGQRASITVVNPEPAGSAAVPVTFVVTPMRGSVYLPLVRR